jgi:hypothetical protein
MISFRDAEVAGSKSAFPTKPTTPTTPPPHSLKISWSGRFSGALIFCLPIPSRVHRALDERQRTDLEGNGAPGGRRRRARRRS